MVDAAGWGQYPKCINDRGKEVASSDKLSNIMFSVHIYQDAGANDAKARQSIDYTLGAGVPALVGEFAYAHQGYDVAYQSVMDYCTQKNVGYMVWSWTGNGSGAETCDMFGSFDDSQWKTNGEKTVNGTNGIKATAKECSVFSVTTPGGDENNGGSADGDELVLVSPNQYFYDWNQDPVHIPASKFANASASDELRIYYSASSYGAEIQLAYNDFSNNWIETVPYKGINGNNFETQKLGSILQYVKANGFYVKGHGFTFQKATLFKKQSGVNEVVSETELPVEIFTLQGIRVAEMQPGSIYIVRQGDKVSKVIYR